MKSWKQKIYKNQKLIIYGVITACLVFANYKLFFKPTIGSLMETMPQVGQLQRRLNAASSAVANIPRYKNQTEELRKGLSLHKKKFSTKEQTSFLLQELSEIARESGVKILSIKPHSVTAAAEEGAVSIPYQKFPISIRASCGYHQLGRFLNNLENADNFMRVTDIDITADPQNTVEHNAYILVNTYILTEGP